MPLQRRFQHGGALPMGIIPMPLDAMGDLGLQRLERRRVRPGQQQPHSRRPVGDAELANRLLDVPVHGLGCDLQPPPDLLGGPVLRGQFQALALARRQPIERSGG